MFKKLGLMILMVVMLLCLFTLQGKAVSQIDMYRYLYPQNALYGVVTLEWDAPITAATETVMGAVNISTATLVAGASSFLAVNFTQPDYPRTISIIVSSAATGATMVLSVSIQGYDSIGVERSESVSVSTSATATSNYAFAYISTMTITLTSITGGSGYGSLEIAFGVGAKLGLPADINAATDVFVIIENGASVLVASQANATYNTIDFASDPDTSKDYQVWIRQPIVKKSIADE